MDDKISKPYNKIYINGGSDFIRFSIMPFPSVEPAVELYDQYTQILEDIRANIYTDYEVNGPFSYIKYYPEAFFSQKHSCWYQLDLFANSCQDTGSDIENTTDGNFIKLHQDQGGVDCWFTEHGSTDSGGWNFENYNNFYSSSDGTSEFSVKLDRNTTDIDAVYNKPGDYVIVVDNQQYLTQWEPRGRPDIRNTINLTTSLADSLGEKFFNEGLTSFLSLNTQQGFQESSLVGKVYLPWWPWPSQRSISVDHIDFKGAYGLYYRELFFHTPFLIAHHLNANQKFKEAKWWYERIFDPTGTETPDSKNPNERNWRYLEFRKHSIEGIKDILTDKVTIEKYEEDPFSPHAIARLRMTAYQKTIVMKYIDNLLDWGDSLFAQDSMESINEATMLYVLAADILGKRPVQLGKCDTVPDVALTYKQISAEINEDDDFLLTMENWHTVAPVERVQLASHRANYEMLEVSPGEERPIRPILSVIQPEYKMQPHAEIMVMPPDESISEA